MYKSVEDITLYLYVDKEKYELVANGKSKNINIQNGTRLKANILPLSFSFEPSYTLFVTSTSKNIRKSFALDFKPVLSTSSSYYLLILYNIILATFFIICYYLAKSIDEAYDFKFWVIPFQFIFLSLYILTLFVAIVYMLFEDWKIAIGVPLFIHLPLWYVALKKSNKQTRFMVQSTLKTIKMPKRKKKQAVDEIGEKV